MTDTLWTPAECAEYLRVSQRYLRASTCPRVKLPPSRGSRPIIRYDPAAVRRWWEGKRTPQQKAG